MASNQHQHQGYESGADQEERSGRSQSSSAMSNKSKGTGSLGLEKGALYASTAVDTAEGMTSTDTNTDFEDLEKSNDSTRQTMGSAATAAHKTESSMLDAAKYAQEKTQDSVNQMKENTSGSAVKDENGKQKKAAALEESVIGSVEDDNKSGAKASDGGAKAREEELMEAVISA
ncbi:hypothetical protein KP509_29G043800 [Ceratopteris richardii]|uniref:Uncharacterized protein n=1 Tax=Ceratopteris richardii TaxID=49495 RepID=A0A8T2R7P6_CERRI|nr:hypothetical protein KP509_29G043800 [Ceratopteris richardii]